MKNVWHGASSLVEFRVSDLWSGSSDRDHHGSDPTWQKPQEPPALGAPAVAGSSHGSRHKKIGMELLPLSAPAGFSR